MKKGSSLIEVVIYLSMLSILIIGVFSSILDTVYFQSKNTSFTHEDYSHLIQNYHEED